jgi:hypothetical protein
MCASSLAASALTAAVLLLRMQLSYLLLSVGAAIKHRFRWMFCTLCNRKHVLHRLKMLKCFEVLGYLVHEGMVCL